MKIKLTNYPYREFKIGDICDFGEEQNRNLVAMQRAVWYGAIPPKKLFTPPPPPPPPQPEPELPKNQDQVIKKPKGSKKLVTNELQEVVSAKKEEIAETESHKPVKKSIWDRLK